MHSAYFAVLLVRIYERIRQKSQVGSSAIVMTYPKQAIYRWARKADRVSALSSLSSISIDSVRLPRILHGHHLVQAQRLHRCRFRITVSLKRFLAVLVVQRDRVLMQDREIVGLEESSIDLAPHWMCQEINTSDNSDTSMRFLATHSREPWRSSVYRSRPA